MTVGIGAVPALVVSAKMREAVTYADVTVFWGELECDFYLPLTMKDALHQKSWVEILDNLLLSGYPSDGPTDQLAYFYDHGGREMFDHNYQEKKRQASVRIT